MKFKTVGLLLHRRRLIRPRVSPHRVIRQRAQTPPLPPPPLQATCNTYKRGKMCPFDKCCLFAHGINELRRCPLQQGSNSMCVSLFSRGFVRAACCATASAS